MIHILGGRGFVGSAFARLCEAEAREHRVITRENYDELRGTACDLFINANGNSKKFLARDEPLAEFDMSTRSVRASLLDFPCERYLHLSSCDVYPDCSSPETTGEDQTIDPARQSPYGFHKHLAEFCVRHQAQKWLIVRMGGFVGPNLKKNAIFDILNGGPLWLDPASELQFIHTDDSARIIMNLVEDGVENDVLNVCGKGVVRLSQVMEWANRPDVPVQPDSPRVHYEVDVTKAARLADVPASADTVRKFIEASAGTA